MGGHPSRSWGDWRGGCMEGAAGITCSLCLERWRAGRGGSMISNSLKSPSFHGNVCLVNIRQHQHWLHFIMTFLEHGQTSCSATFLFPVHFQSFPHLTLCCWLFLHEMPVNYWYARLFFHEPLYIESALNYWGKLDKSARVDRRSTSDSLCNISAVFAVSVSHLVIQLELYVGDQRRQTTLWWSVLCVCLMIYTRLQPCRRTSGLTPPESWPD